MKRIICAALICALVLALGACSGKNALGLAEPEAGAPAQESRETAPQKETPPNTTEGAAELPQAEESGKPVVCFTSGISAEDLVRVYEALGWEPSENVAVKISTGEPPSSNYLRPELISALSPQPHTFTLL